MPEGTFTRRHLVYMHSVHKCNKKNAGMTKPKVDKLKSLSNYSIKVDAIIISN